MTRNQISHATDAVLAFRLDQIEEITDPTEEELTEAGWIEGEQDARALWKDDDARVRESVGNYR